MNIRALVAELVGTFILVVVGSLGVWAYAVATSAQGDPLTALVIIPFAFGLGLMAAIAIAGPASGGHFNPAVTLAALFDGRVDWKNAIGYVVAQIFGALAASLTITLLASSDVVAASVNHPGPIAQALFDKEIRAFVVEALLTTIFVAVILTVTRKAPGQAIIVIPLTLVVIHFVGIFISGASVNPAPLARAGRRVGHVRVAVGLPHRSVRRLDRRLGHLPLPERGGRRRDRGTGRRPRRARRRGRRRPLGRTDRVPARVRRRMRLP